MDLRNILKWIAISGGGLITLAVAFLSYQLYGYSRAVDRIYDVDPPAIVASADSAIIARGRHLAESLGGCFGCHGTRLEGKEVDDLGPIGVMRAPNLTTGRGGVGGDYSDGQLARAVKHGIGSDGKTLIFMPSPDFNWWPENELAALVSFVRSLPPVDNEVEPTSVGLLGKVLNQFGVMPLTVAALIDHDAAAEDVPEPEPTARYGEFLTRGCVGCHGENMSGGPIPGAPASLPTPANITFDATGLGDWTEADFVSVLNTGVRPDGRRLDPFMPIESTRAMNATEKSAVWAYLRSLPPVEFGNR